MPTKIQLGVPPMGAVAKLTLLARDDKGMKKLIEACKELGFIGVLPGDSALEWDVLFSTPKLRMTPDAEELRHFIRLVEGHLDGVCEFDCHGKKLTQQEWIDRVLKPIRERKGK